MKSDNDTERGMPTGTLSSIKAKDGLISLFSISVGDRPVCVIGLELLEKAVKQARAAMSAIGVNADLVEPRDAECQELLGRMKPLDDVAQAQLALGIPVRCLDTLRAGLSLEWEKLTKLEKVQQELVMETDETQLRMRQLDRIMSSVDVARLGAPAA